MDFLPGLVAPIVGVLSLNWVNKLFVSFTFAHFIVCLNDVGTLDETYVICEFQLASKQAPFLF